MTLSTVSGYLEPSLDKVREMISDSLRSDISLLNATNDSLLAHPGKMMRPMLALLSARVCSGGRLTTDTYRCAAASQLLHTATLLHDDVADDGQSRRGEPTVLHMLGGRASVLLGDYWLEKAMDRILDSDRHREEAIRLFAATLGHLADGEMLQLQKASTGDTTEADYYRIIYCKTASLFESSAVSGALSVNASEESISAVRSYAKYLGLAFQIKDDLFDYEPGAQVGKPVGQDLMEQKITLPLLGALANAPEDEAAAVRQKVVKIGEDPSLREEIVDFVGRYMGMEYAEARLLDHVDRAISFLSIFPEGKDRDCLEALARISAERKL